MRKKIRRGKVLREEIRKCMLEEQTKIREGKASTIQKHSDDQVKQWAESLLSE